MSLSLDKRTAITNAANELFSNFGYKSVSMDQIAQKANVAKGTLYLYFKDKDDLYYYIAKKIIDDIKSYIEHVKNQRLSLVDEIHKVMYNMLMYRKNQKFLFTIAKEATELRTPAACKVMRMVDDELVNYLKKALDYAVKEKMIKSFNTSIMTFVILKIYTALAFEWDETHQEPLNESQIVNSIGIILKDGLLTRK